MLLGSLQLYKNFKEKQMIRNGKMPLENSRFPFKLLKCWSSTLLFIFSSISLLYLLLLWSIESFEALKTRSGAQETHETPLEAVTKVHHVEDEEDFDNKLKNAGDKVVLVDFFATWCMPCVTITPYLDNFAEKYSGRLLILKIDVDELTDLAMGRFKIDLMPTFIYFKNGEIVERFSGGSDAKIETAIQKYIA